MLKVIYEYLVLYSFTDMDVIMNLEAGEHYVKIAARTGLILKATIKLIIVENNTEVQHRYVMVELARKGQLNDVLKMSLYLLNSYAGKKG